MNFPQWQCPPNLKNSFFQFLQASQANKHSDSNNLTEYHQLTQHFPLSEEITTELKEFTDKPLECIEISESEEEPDLKPPDQDNELIETIIDCINTEGQVSQDIFEELSLLGRQPLEEVFLTLSQKCSLEECRLFWGSLQESPLKFLQESFVQFMLIPKLRQQFVNESLELFNAVSLTHQALLEEKLLKTLLNTEENNVLLQYVCYLGPQFAAKLLSSMKKLHPSYIPTIETLMVADMELPIWLNLLELMAGVAPDFCQDNAYGKLLFKLVDSMEKIPENMGRSLRRILEFHRSIWKVKVEKVVCRKMGDFNLTQSFV